VSRNHETVRVQTPAGSVTAAATAASAGHELPSEVKLSIRPEQMRIASTDAAATDGANRLVGEPVETTFLGEASEHVLLVNGHRLKVVSAPPLFDVPDQMAVEFDPQDVVVLAN
jgi:ABC-type Fe3+/spermidine/putrescine transport system ATPase subunit